VNNRSMGAQLAIFLRSNEARPYCDECLLEEIPGAHITDVDRASAMLRESPDFLFEEAAACGRFAQKKAADNGCGMRMAGPGVRLRKGSNEAAATIRQLATIDRDRLSGIRDRGAWRPVCPRLGQTISTKPCAGRGATAVTVWSPGHP
jgi:hypothetical protein